MTSKLIFPYQVNNTQNLRKIESYTKYGIVDNGRELIDLSLGSCGCFPLGFKRQDIIDAVSEKMKALLQIAAKVQIGGKEVKPEHIEAAKNAGASDEDIHDAVLIASAFCMYNRYVDGLGTNLPDSDDEYADMGKNMARKGYKYPPLFMRKWVIRQMQKANKKKQFVSK